MQSRNFWLSKEVILSLAFGLLVAVPLVVFGGSKTIYVDKDASGSEEGTSSHPYHTIDKALDKAKDGTIVRIKDGTYKENVTVPKGVQLRSNAFKRDAVVIKGDDKEPTITMKDGSHLDKLTIDGGRHGVRILENAKVGISDILVKNSDRDGIHIDSASRRDKKHQVYIEDSEIRNSDRTGIYSEKRYVILVNNDIRNNHADGIDFAAGTKAWLENNRINSNTGSGAKFILDSASIYGKKNGFRYNKREGLEVNAYGVAGTIELKRSAFINNDRNGVARVARTASGMSMFGNLSFGIGSNGSRFEENSFGSISSIVRGF